MTTTRAQIENHSRAAFYIKGRGHGMTAARAYEAAAGGLARYQEAAEAARAAEDSLAAMWQGLGKSEPKRYGPDGQALQAARDTARKARKALVNAGAYRGTAEGAYLGTWQPRKPGFYYCHKPDSVFRNVTRAESVCRDLPGGYYDNPYGESSRHDDSGLVVAYVGQLPGRDGAARYVAGYNFGSTDSGGITFDLGTIFAAPGDDSETAQAEAARAADSLAEAAAEAERDYQAAYGAGQQWADLGAEVAAYRAACLAILAERRGAMAAAQSLPAICRALRDTVSGYCRDIAKARAERAALAAGQSDCVVWSWSRHDESGLVAFAEGAGLDLPAARGLCS